MLFDANICDIVNVRMSNMFIMFHWMYYEGGDKIEKKKNGNGEHIIIGRDNV